MQEPKTGTLAPRFAAIRELFGKVAEVLTGKPTPSLTTARRKRREETARGFRTLTLKLTRKVLHTPPPDAIRLWLADTLDWTQLWSEEPEPFTQPDPEPTRPDSFDLSGDFSADL